MKKGKRIREIVDRVIGSERANYPRALRVYGHDEVTIDFIKSTECRHIAEFGIFEGYTSLEFARFLNNRGELHLFDYQDRVDAVQKKLAEAGFRNVRTFGCSYKLMDSYNWSLAKLLEESSGPIYDYAFLDGAHTWAVDALNMLLADRLLKVGGYMDFDDYNWSLRKSPSMNPKKFPLTKKMFTEEQIDAKQVKMIVDILVRKDTRYREVVPNKIFQKIA
jgi:predicted O-methyltransferase YrrM